MDSKLTAEQIDYAESMDILSFFQITDPGNLKQISQTNYQLRNHDSFKITLKENEILWYWWSRGYGGKGAISYLMKTQNISFVESVKELCHLNSYNFISENKEIASKIIKKKEFVLPEQNRDVHGYVNNDRVIAYLTKTRKIDKSIVKELIQNGFIYEELEHHNAVFVGCNQDNKAVCASCRGTISNKKFVQEIEGGNKDFPFSLFNQNATELHVFESPIDLMSYATILKMCNRNYKTQDLLSLSGIYKPSKNNTFKMPNAITKSLENNKNIKKVYLHLDNDGPGKETTKAIHSEIEKLGISAVDSPALVGKDFNDFLIAIKQDSKILRKER